MESAYHWNVAVMNVIWILPAVIVRSPVHLGSVVNKANYLSNRDHEMGRRETTSK